MSMLHVRALSRKINNIKALDGVSFTVEGGEIFALLGPGARGKTTTLRAVSGDESFDSGRVVFDGVDVTRTSVQGRGMATVFQNFALAGQVVELEVDAAVANLAAGSAVTIGIRPCALEITSEPDPDSLTGQVHRIEPMGGEALVHLLAASLDIRTVVPRDLDLLPGEQVHLRCRPSQAQAQAQVFDDRGERVFS